MREMAAVVPLGLAAGAITAYLTGSYIETQLFGVNAGDWPRVRDQHRHPAHGCARRLIPAGVAGVPDFTDSRVASE